jgi:hypothetical protein
MTLFTAYPSPPDQWQRWWADALIQALIQAQTEDEADDTETTAAAATNRRWIDGSRIWRMVVPLTEAFLSTNATAIAHGIGDLAVLVGATGIWRKDGGTQGIIPPGAYVVGGTNVTSVVTGSPDWSDLAAAYLMMEFTRA